MSFISVVLLAAGESKRMGQSKLLMSWQGRTIVEQTIDNYLASKASEIIVVLGHKADESAAVIGNKPVATVVNHNYQQGMGTSLVCGLKQISPESQGIMMALADQPKIDAGTIDKVIDSFEKSKSGIVFPTYRGKRGHPIIFDIAYKEELLTIEGDIGAREIVLRHTDKIHEVPVDNEGILVDIDTPADFRNNFAGD